MSASSSTHRETEQVDYKPTDLQSVLAGMRGSEFARDSEAPGAAKPAFKALNWQEMAVKVVIPDPVEEPVLEAVSDVIDTETVEHPTEADFASESQTPGGAAARVAADEAPTPPVQPATEEPPQVSAQAQVRLAELEKEKLQVLQDDAYAEGFSAGKAMTENQREAELTAQFVALEQIIASLSAPDLLDTEALSQNINAAVFELASERIGFALDDMPELLMNRIDRLLDRLAHLSADRTLFVAPEDLGLVQLGLGDTETQPRIELRSDPALSRGDARLRVGGAEICDILEVNHVAPLEPEDQPENDQVEEC
jgi:flagellar assembly protein FliH